MGAAWGRWAVLAWGGSARLSKHRSAPGVPFNSVYCASKFAVEGLCESLAIVLRPFNIQ